MRTIPVHVLVLALFALATPISATAAAPEAALTKSEVPVAGLGYFHDEASTDVFGLEWLGEMADEAVLAKNVSSLVSDARVHFVKAILAEANITGAKPGEYIYWAKKNKKVLALAASSGADLIQIWGNIFSGGLAGVPEKKKDFVPAMGWSFAPTGASVALKWHESAHGFGCGHNPEVSSPGPVWPFAVGELYPDGSCDPVSYCGGNNIPLLSAGNAQMARLAGPWVAAYNAVPPVVQVACVDTVDQACLATDRAVVQVFWVNPEDYSYGFAAKITANGTLATFELGSSRIRVRAVAAQVKKAGKAIKVVNLRFTTLTTAAPSVPYRILVTDLASGHVRAWDFRPGEKATLQVPKAAF